MLVPIGSANLTEAQSLLVEGFPERGAAFWARGLARLREWPGNPAASVPIGHVLMEKTLPVGVVLTPASVRRDADDRIRPLINISSWYIKPDYRWKALVMLRGLFHDPAPIFTDLTPTPDVSRMLEPFGFRGVNSGVLMRPLPLLAAGPSRGWTVRPWDPEDRLSSPSPPVEDVARYRNWGHPALVLERGAVRHLLVLRRFRWRGLPAAGVLHAGSLAAVGEAIHGLARRLIGFGMLVLQIEHRGAAPRSPWFRRRDIWLARGDPFTDRTDHIGSEYGLLGI